MMKRGEFIQEVFLSIFPNIFANEYDYEDDNIDIGQCYENAFRKASYLSNYAAIELETVSGIEEIWA